MSKKVIDASSYQGSVDWKRVKESGAEGAILKIMRKDLSPDRQFEKNWKGAQEAGIPVIGVYNYIYAITEKESKATAKKVVEILNGRKATVWYDAEDGVLLKVSGEKRMRNLEAYRNTIEGAGLAFGVYTGISFYNRYIKPYAKELDCPFWIAKYPSERSMRVTENPPHSKKPVILQELEGWQYSSKGNVPGIAGNADLSLWYKDAAFLGSFAPFIYDGLDYAAVFDPVYYSNRYKDLKDAYGDDEAALFRHFITYGMKEGRQAIDAFNVQAYRARYEDLRKAFGENLPLYYQHYIRYGKAENRISI